MYKTKEEIQNAIYALRGYIRRNNWKVVTLGQQLKYSSTINAMMQEINMAIRLGELSRDDFKW